jgi:hypothetical protein
VGLLVGLAMAGQAVTALRARHEITQVESIVGVHATMLANGEGLYYDLQEYPFTISPYGPVFYSLAAILHKTGLPVLTAGRLISLVSLLAILVVAQRLLWLSTNDRRAAAAGTLLVASTAILLSWGTVGQSDMLALCFSLLAFHQYLRHRSTGRLRPLVWSGISVALAVFTKQSFVAAGASIVLLLLLEHRRRGVVYAACLGGCGLGLALALNTWTQGRYFDNAVLANLNPFSMDKAWDHLRYFLPAAGSLLVLTAAGWVRGERSRFHPLHLYLAVALTVMAVTVPKVGSDLNYQIETILLLGLCSGWSLYRLDFFPLWLRRDPGWVTLLQIPLLLHIAISLSLTGKTIFERNVLDSLRRQEMAALRPYLSTDRGRVLSVQIDPLLQTGRRIEVEPLIYTLLVNSGVVDPEPVRRDLAEGRFSLVLLYEDAFGPRTLSMNPEVPSLPDLHLEEIRKHYRLVAHIPGALLAGDYLYEPIRPPQVNPVRDSNH